MYLVSVFEMKFLLILMFVQFDGIGDHGTKIIVYNLWHNDDGNMELDFNSDSKVSFVFIYFFLCSF